MIENEPCSVCGQPLEPGFLLDESGEKIDRVFWAESDIASYMQGGKRCLPIFATRCTACGRLELFARLTSPVVKIHPTD